MNKKKLLDLIGPAFLCHEINCKPVEQIASDLAEDIMKAYEQPGTPIPTVDEDEDIYKSIYMEVIELVEGDNIQNITYKDTAQKLKQQFSITRK